jgi:hypothetical protein
VGGRQVPTTEEGCKVAALAIGKTIGQLPQFLFSGDWVTKGCYFYDGNGPLAGVAFFGTGGDVAQMQTVGSAGYLAHDGYPNGYDKYSGDASQGQKTRLPCPGLPKSHDLQLVAPLAVFSFRSSRR